MDKDFYNSTAFASKPLKHRLKTLHEHYCTGPCGQSSSVMMARSNTSKTLSDAIATEAEAYALSADLASVKAERDAIAARLAEVEAERDAAKANSVRLEGKLNAARVACDLALEVIADAIMDGMPVTQLVADARNAVARNALAALAPPAEEAPVGPCPECGDTGKTERDPSGGYAMECPACNGGERVPFQPRPTQDPLLVALVKATIPLQVLAMQIKEKPYTELTESFQKKIVEAADLAAKTIAEATKETDE